MDTNRRLDRHEKDNMLASWQRLIARHVASTATTLCPTIFRDLYGASMAPPERAAWEATHSWWESLDDGTKPPFKSENIAGVPVQLLGGAVVMLQINKYTMYGIKYPMWERPKPSTPVHAPDVLGLERYAEFLEWVNLTVGIVLRSNSSVGVLSQIYDLVGTIGQLHRMAPELIRYTYPSTQKALDSQQRRSPLPHGWMDVDRRRLRDALDHLALCYLIDVQSGCSYKELVCDRDWAFDNVTARQDMGYHATPEYRAPFTLSNFDCAAPFT